MKQEIARINNIKYMKDKIIYSDILYFDTVFYNDIVEYYIEFSNYYGKRGKYLIIVTKDNVKHKMCLGVVNVFISIGDFEERNLSMIKKMAPQARYIKRETLKKKIKRKQIDMFLKSDD